MFEISALTREGCEPLIQAIYRHVASFQTHHVEPDVRFDAPRVDAPEEGAPGFVAQPDDPRFR